MDLPLDGSDTDPEGDIRTTRFIQWARNVIGNGDESEYPLKHLTDSLIIDRFMNLNHERQPWEFIIETMRQSSKGGSGFV